MIINFTVSLLIVPTSLSCKGGRMLDERRRLARAKVLTLQLIVDDGGMM
jgi:hypothetical protein